MELFTECVCLMVPYLLKHDAMTPRGASPASGESKPASQPTNEARAGHGDEVLARSLSCARRIIWDGIGLWQAGRQADQGVVM